MGRARATFWRAELTAEFKTQSSKQSEFAWAQAQYLLKKLCCGQAPPREKTTAIAVIIEQIFCCEASVHLERFD